MLARKEKIVPDVFVIQKWAFHSTSRVGRGEDGVGADGMLPNTEWTEVPRLSRR